MIVSYSIIIPAYNEEAWLPTTLEALEKAMKVTDMPGEVIVVDNNSTDRTPEIAREYNARLVFEPVNQISRARNAGAKVARGRYLIFLDADTILPPVLLQIALANLSNGTCCGGGALVALDRPLDIFAKNLVNLWNWISMKHRMAAGSFIYCLREAFEGAGGFSETVYAGEEIRFSRQLRLWGSERGMTFQIIMDPPVVTSGRKLDWFSPVQQVLLLLMMVLYPLVVRSRSLCSFWYTRPFDK
jgi:glycosyltransferase involved in cell wall biosynthesis